ncbi:hypothetical protein ACQ4M4_12315 [Leptolyngbya sp. AN02str]|uniref:hypothetical protein n=1 Tax=Leptolyngbya sp. AN02str TaxID=3423363 RepID=UPI003D316A45
MKQMIRNSTLAAVMLLTNALMACSENVLSPPQSNRFEMEVHSSSNASSTNLTGWSPILEPTSAPQNWQIAPCENPVLLCVYANGERIGTVERFRYPASEAAPLNEVALIQGSELSFLQALVENHYVAFEQDRRIADPALRFSADAPEAMVVGGLPGLSFGYLTSHPNGTSFERMVGYMATDGEMVYVFSTGVMNGDSTGLFTNEVDFRLFEPYLDDMMQNLSLLPGL